MTIKEMATAYGKANPNTSYDADGDRYDDIYGPTIDYEAGAMDVLNELESYIGNNDDLAVNFIKDKIKELKGE